MENAHIVLPLLRGVVHKKLEDLVLTAFDKPGFVPPEIFEAREIAKENKFLDIESGIDEIFREVGEIQVKRTFERRENQIIQRVERAMQDYFVANGGEKLNLIEPGLIYQSHEKVTRAGRLDIVAKDSNGVNVTIELKARDYDARNVCLQLMRYSNEQDGRLFFVAPTVKPELFFTLSRMPNGKKFEFFEVSQDNGDYSVRRVTEEEFEIPKEIEWNKATRTRNDNGLVRVTAEVSHRGNGKRNAVKEGLDIGSHAFEGGERIKQGSFHEEFNNLSLLEKIAAISGLELNRPNGEKYKIPEINYKILMNSLKVGLKPYPERPTWESVKEMFEKISLQDRREAKIVNRFINFANVGAGRKGLDEILSQIITLYGPCTEKGAVRFKIGDEKFQCDAGLDNRIILVDRGIAELRKYHGSFYYLDEYKKLESLLAKRRKLVSNSRVNDAMAAALSWVDKDGSEAVLQALELKSERAKLLHWVDPNLAFIYMTNTPAINYLLENKTLFGRGKITISDGELREFIRNDQQLYREILELIEPIPESRPIDLEERKSPVETINNEAKPIQTIYDKTNGNGMHERERVYHGRDLTNGTKLHHPSEAVKWAPETFVEDVLNNNAYSVSLKDRMAAAIVNSGWYSRGLDDRQVLNFFGDLRVYAAQGRVPNKGEMKELLEKSS